MNNTFKPVALLAIAILMAGAHAVAQDEPSLGDLARQQRQQKAAQAKDAKPPKTFTNEQVSRRHDTTPSPAAKTTEPVAPPDSTDNPQPSAEQWKSEILSQKDQISALQSQIDEINASIRFAPANCVANCVAWNERQKQKQQQVEQMQTQLEEQKRQLDEAQESARKEGYGSSVYDP